MSRYHRASRIAGPDPSLADWAAESGIRPTAPTAERAAVSVTVDQADPRRAALWHLSDYAVSTSAGAVVWLVPKAAGRESRGAARAASWLPPSLDPTNLEIDEVGEFWVVTAPTAESELDDILFSRTVASIGVSYKGGLEPVEIIGLFTDAGRAREFAARKLAEATGADPAGPTAGRRAAFDHRDDSLLDGLSFGELIDAVYSNERTVDEAAVRRTFGEIVRTQMQDAEHELSASMGQIVAEARG